MENKRKRLNRRIGWGMILALLLNVWGAACAAEVPTAENAAQNGNGAFLLRNAITWDTTVQEMKEMMGAENVTLINRDGYDEYDIMDVAVSNYKAMMGFMYLGSQLAIVGYSFAMDDLTEEDFVYLQDGMCVKYGEPSVFEVKRLLKVFFSMDESTVTSQSDIDHFCGWVLSDGTLIMMFINDDVAGILYCNEARIYQHRYSDQNTEGL